MKFIQFCKLMKESFDDISYIININAAPLNFTELSLYSIVFVAKSTPIVD